MQIVELGCDGWRRWNQAVYPYGVARYCGVGGQKSSISLHVFCLFQVSVHENGPLCHQIWAVGMALHFPARAWMLYQSTMYFYTV